jgi:hypothetical protein
MSLTRDGNVGIGTASPSYGLDIQSSDASKAYINVTFTGFASTFLQAFNGIGLTGTRSNDPFAIATNNTERMRITSGGDVAIGATSTNGRLGVRGTTNDSSAYAFEAANSSGNSLSLVRNDGLIIFPSLVSTFTTGSAANMFVSPGDGAIYRSTSSIKYKKNVEDYNKGLTELMQMRPVFYEGISESDEGKIFAGLIAEEVHDLGLTEFVQYAEDGSPDSLAYQNMVALLIKSIQELKAEIDSLKTK